MKNILRYIKIYAQETDKRIFVLSTVFVAIAIFINYRFHLNGVIYSLNEIFQYTCWFLLFLIAFSFAYLLQAFFFKTNIFKDKNFLSLLIIAPAIFAWKMSFDFEFHFTNNTALNIYWNQVLYWPLKLFVVSACVFLIWNVYDRDQRFYGFDVRNFRIKPYLLMLLIMVPLVAMASTQPDFLHMYPKLKNITYLSGSTENGLYKLLFELSYGSDFFTIELFFRGFLILAFAKWAGKEAILPMAVFYCTIHFGKPLGECISSFFGGLILGIVIYHARTISGGLMVHLGIAWLMELGGYLGNL